MYNETIAMNVRSSQPMYIQIKEALKKRILEGDYATHERLPSESELMKMFGVSRITVRQALRDLHGDGLVFSVQGKGTFVSKPKAVQDMQRLQGFGEAMTPQGYETSTRVMCNEYIRPSVEIANAFGINRSMRVLNVRRVRYLNREPISVDDSYFPENIGKHLYVRDLNQDIFPMLENELNTMLSYAELKIESVSASAEVASQLNIEPNSPILKIIRMVYSQENKLIDFEYLYYRGESFQYQLRVNRY